MVNILKHLKSWQRLNNFFKEKVEILASKIIIDDSIDPLNKLREKVKDLNLSFKLKTVSEKEVFDIIRKLKNKRSSCFDGISSEIMKLSGQTLVAPLTWIINSSIVNGTFPSQWKQACVTPLHKRADRFQLKNYRPVALLSVPGMIR